MSWFRKLLGRDDAAVCPIEFDATGWHPQPSTAPDTWQWKDDAGDTLTVRVAPKAAFGGGDLSDLGRLRTACRDNAKQANCSIVQVDTVRA